MNHEDTKGTKEAVMPTIREQVETLTTACPGAKPLYFEVTGWFLDVPWDEIETVELEFRRKFVPKRGELVELLGVPTWTLPRDREWFDRWYPEALEAAAWQRDDKIVCLAVAHHDKETPVALLLRCLTKSELEELSA